MPSKNSGDVQLKTSYDTMKQANATGLVVISLGEYNSLLKRTQQLSSATSAHLGNIACFVGATALPLGHWFYCFWAHDCSPLGSLVLRLLSTWLMHLFYSLHLLILMSFLLMVLLCVLLDRELSTLHHLFHYCLFIMPFNFLFNLFSVSKLIKSFLFFFFVVIFYHSFVFQDFNTRWGLLGAWKEWLVLYRSGSKNGSLMPYSGLFFCLSMALSSGASISPKIEASSSVWCRM